MSTKYKFRNPDGCYFITFATVGWVDVFTRRAYRDVLIESLEYCQKEKGLELLPGVSCPIMYISLPGPKKAIGGTSCKLGPTKGTGKGLLEVELF